MFDSQKLTFEKFMLSYKHGIYVFTEDSCQICHDYKKTIEHINNPNLYFVEVLDEHDRKAAYEMMQRAAFPMTACWKDNEVQYVRLGQLFDLQLQEIYASLQEFGDSALSQEEIDKRVKAINTRCKLSYYVFPPSCADDVKTKLMEKAIDYNELPIDVDSVVPTLSFEQRVHLISGNYAFAKLIIFKDEDTNIYSDIGQAAIIGYTNTNKDAKFEIRKIADVLGENNAADSSNS